MLALAVVVVLALGLVWKARQSEEQAARADAEAARATTAQNEATAQLWSARFNEARAIRIAGGPGARQRAEEILLTLARHPGLGETQRVALRSEAIAQFALLDVDPATNWIRGEVAGAPAAGWFLPGTTGTVVEVRRFADSNLVARFSGPVGAGQSYFSPGGSVVLTTFKTDPPTVLAWRVTGGAVVFSNTVAPATIYGASPPAFSMDERLVAFNSRSTLLIRSLGDGGVLRRRAPATAYCFSPDASQIACAFKDEVVIEDTATGVVRARFNAGLNVAQITWRPQGDRLGLTGHGGAVALAELPPEGTERPPSLRRAAGHAGTPIFARFTPDGAALITTSWDGFSNFWEPHSGTAAPG